VKIHARKIANLFRQNVLVESIGLIAIIISKMLKPEDIKIDAKIRCLKPGQWFGVIGTIKRIDLHVIDGSMCWHVYKANSDPLGDGPIWTKLKYFELVEPASQQAIKSRECPCGIYRADCDYHK
jgi:hypothetical protein